MVSKGYRKGIACHADGILKRDGDPLTHSVHSFMNGCTDKNVCTNGSSGDVVTRVASSSMGMASNFSRHAEDSNVSFKKRFCPKCSQPGKAVSLKLCKINSDEAMYICIKPNCCYPLSEDDSDMFVVQCSSPLAAMQRRKRKQCDRSSISLPSKYPKLKDNRLSNEKCSSLQERNVCVGGNAISPGKDAAQIDTSKLKLSDQFIDFNTLPTFNEDISCTSTTSSNAMPAVSSLSEEFSTVNEDTPSSFQCDQNLSEIFRKSISAVHQDNASTSGLKTFIPLHDADKVLSSTESNTEPSSLKIDSILDDSSSLSQQIRETKSLDSPSLAVNNHASSVASEISRKNISATHQDTATISGLKIFIPQHDVDRVLAVGESNTEPSLKINSVTDSSSINDSTCEAKPLNSPSLAGNSHAPSVASINLSAPVISISGNPHTSTNSADVTKSLDNPNNVEESLDILKCTSDLKELGAPPRHSELLQWQNEKNLCWLDVLLQCIVNSTNVRATLNCSLGFELRKDYIFHSLCKVYDDAQRKFNNRASKLVSCKDKLSSEYTDLLESLRQARLDIFKVLQTRFSLNEGIHESAREMFPNLVRLDHVMNFLFSVKIRWEFVCVECGHKRVRQATTSIVSFPSTTPDFHPLNAMFARPCFNCAAENQLMNMIMENVPPCLMMHFQEGLPHNRVQVLDFGVCRNLYSVCVIIQYITNPCNHFVAWIRNCITNKWLCCDDLQKPLCKWQSNAPRIPPNQIHMVMWEKQGLDNPLAPPPGCNDIRRIHLSHLQNEEVAVSDNSQSEIEQPIGGIETIVVDDDPASISSNANVSTSAHLLEKKNNGNSVSEVQGLPSESAADKQFTRVVLHHQMFDEDSENSNSVDDESDTLPDISTPVARKEKLRRRNQKSKISSMEGHHNTEVVEVDTTEKDVCSKQSSSSMTMQGTFGNKTPSHCNVNIPENNETLVKLSCIKPEKGLVSMSTSISSSDSSDSDETNEYDAVSPQVTKTPTCTPNVNVLENNETLVTLSCIKPEKGLVSMSTSISSSDSSDSDETNEYDAVSPQVTKTPTLKVVPVRLQASTSKLLSSYVHIISSDSSDDDDDVSNADFSEDIKLLSKKRSPKVKQSPKHVLITKANSMLSSSDSSDSDDSDFGSMFSKEIKLVKEECEKILSKSSSDKLDLIPYLKLEDCFSSTSSHGTSVNDNTYLRGGKLSEAAETILEHVKYETSSIKNENHSCKLHHDQEEMISCSQPAQHSEKSISVEGMCSARGVSSDLDDIPELFTSSNNLMTSSLSPTFNQDVDSDMKDKNHHISNLTCLLPEKDIGKRENIALDTQMDSGEIDLGPDSSDKASSGQLKVNVPSLTKRGHRRNISSVLSKVSTSNNEQSIKRTNLDLKPPQTDNKLKGPIIEAIHSLNDERNSFVDVSKPLNEIKIRNKVFYDGFSHSSYKPKSLSNVKNSASSNSFESTTNSPSQEVSNHGLVPDNSAAMEVSNSHQTLQPSSNSLPSKMSILQPTNDAESTPLQLQQKGSTTCGRSKTCSNSVNFRDFCIKSFPPNSKLVGNGGQFESYKPKRAIRVTGCETTNLIPKTSDIWSQQPYDKPNLTEDKFQSENKTPSIGFSEISSELSELSDLLDFEQFGNGNLSFSLNAVSNEASPSVDASIVTSGCSLAGDSPCVTSKYNCDSDAPTSLAAPFVDFSKYNSLHPSSYSNTLTETSATTQLEDLIENSDVNFTGDASTNFVSAADSSATNTVNEKVYSESTRETDNMFDFLSLFKV